MNRPIAAALVRSRPVLLIGAVLLAGALLAAWKASDLRADGAASAGLPEPAEVVTAAPAAVRPWQASTTAIGTVHALRSVTLRNELAGTVRLARLAPGQVVEAGTVLVALDVDVEEADLQAQRARAELARTSLERTERLSADAAVSREELDRARADRDVALAEMARTRAIIERKTIRAPFRARIGISDVHPGQYLSEGTELTTLQGVDDAAHVDFAVAQEVAAGLRVGQRVELLGADDGAPLAATLVAVDSRVNPATRNATVRARVAAADRTPGPGSSVRVRVPVGPERSTVVVPVSALRKGPGGDHVFVIAQAGDGVTRASLRAVRAGDVIGDEVVILEGLEAGEQVATSGSFKLREGALVHVADPAAAAAPAAEGGAQ
ncbi:MAG TPA: efflux RND transporter periplasmic adaptor subunit [Gemmatimonadales bacterium]|nr:efflux RND transporter periplasmic adaptor subunit [Gemmatimonadales bacterium]